MDRSVSIEVLSEQTWYQLFLESLDICFDRTFWTNMDWKIDTILDLVQFYAITLFIGEFLLDRFWDKVQWLILHIGEIIVLV